MPSNKSRQAVSINIEIITNPSAKYDPEGTAGIINVITKKNSLNGLSGLVNGVVGNYENYGGDFLINWRTNKFNVYAGADYNHRNYPGSREEKNQTIVNDTTYFLNSFGEGKSFRNTKSARTGFDLFLSDATVLSAGVRFGDQKRDRTNIQNYEEYYTVGGNETEPYEYSGENSFIREGNFYSLNFSLDHKFQKEGHQLKFEGYYSDDEMDENTLTSEFAGATQVDGKIADGLEKETELRLKADYTLPINEKYKLEAGWQTDIEKENAENVTSFWINNGWVVQNQYSYSSSSQKNIHAGYVTLAAELNRWGVQAGFRAELTDRSIAKIGPGEEFTLNRWITSPPFIRRTSLPTTCKPWLVIPVGSTAQGVISWNPMKFIGMPITSGSGIQI